jgi:acyl-CoA hydrolase
MPLTMDPKSVSASQAVLSHWMGPTDSNSAGNIHGGVVMRLVDEAAALAAIKHARTRVVTVGMDRMIFLVPIYVGEYLTLSASVNAAWRTSMEVGVRVESENPLTGDRRHTNTAYLTMVALDAEGQPAPVPPLLATSATERRRMRDAEMRRQGRLTERAEMQAHRERSDG